jgi:hypothetical protein
VLSEDQLYVRVRDELTAQVAEIEASPELASLVRQRLGRRRQHNSAILALVAALVVVGIAVPTLVGHSTVGSNTSKPVEKHPGVQVDGPAFSLAGYDGHLPSGYRFDTTHNETCRKFWIYSGPMPSSGQALPSDQGSAQLAFQAAGTTGCLTIENSANYSSGPKGPGERGDPVVPKGAKALTIDSYHAFIYQMSGQPTVALYVEIPTTAGEYHDLLVAAQGMSSADLIALVQRALPTRGETSAVTNVAMRSSTTTP